MVPMDDKEFSEGADNLLTPYYVVKVDAAFARQGGGLLVSHGPPGGNSFNTLPKFADLISPC